MFFSDLWRQENKLQQEVATLKEDMSKAEQSLRSMVGKPVLNGRDSVLKVLESFKTRGNGPWSKLPEQYYGLVIENFDCDKSIYTAVEVTAGNRSVRFVSCQKNSFSLTMSSIPHCLIVTKEPTHGLLRTRKLRDISVDLYLWRELIVTG